MYSPFQLAFRYFRYYVTAMNGKGHGVHSPFVYDFIRNVLMDDRHFYAYEQVEGMRRRLLSDSRLLQVEDFGAGSVTGASASRSVASIARSAAKSKKLGQLLFRIVAYYRPVAVLELGTSLGVSTSYLAMGNLSASVVTLEGSTAIAAVASSNFSSLGLKNVEVRVGEFGVTLPSVLASLPRVDLVFVDGNHRYQPTMDYIALLLPHVHAGSILIFDDIHWSAEMERAWKEVCAHPAVRLTIDLFFIGIVFFRDDFKVKQDFVVRY